MCVSTYWCVLTFVMVMVSNLCFSLFMNQSDKKAIFLYVRLSLSLSSFTKAVWMSFLNNTIETLCVLEMSLTKMMEKRYKYIFGNRIEVLMLKNKEKIADDNYIGSRFSNRKRNGETKRNRNCRCHIERKMLSMKDCAVQKKEKKKTNRIR